MSHVITNSYRAKGYARLGAATNTHVRKLEAVMQRLEYESLIDAGDIWMRYKPRRAATFPPAAAQVLGSLSASSPTWDVHWIKHIPERYDAHRRSASLAECRTTLGGFAHTAPFRHLYGLDTALAMVARHDREQFLQQDFMPAFKSYFPDGRVIFVAPVFGMESHLPLLRLGNYYQINGPAALDDLFRNSITVTKTATSLHQSGVVAVEDALRTLVGNFLPLRACTVGRGFGYHAIYLYGQSPPGIIDRGSYPREEIESHTPQFFLRGDDAKGFADSLESPIAGWGGRFRNTEYPGDDATAQLITFFISRFNEHAANRIEVCNFVDGDNIDFITCFEKYLTIDRILLECNMLATATNPATARLLTFAILDKFHELCRFPGRDPNRNFHYFCTRPFLNDVLHPAFATLPEPWNAFFTRAADRLYDDLYCTVRSQKGVWPDFLVQPAGGVRVYREWDAHSQQFVDRPTVVSDDDYVSEYIRSARNTHHGYVSRSDKRRRFACYGSISTAFIPDSFTQLPLLITLADVLKPRLLSGHHWL